MANDWVTADTFDAIRLNQKTRFIGTGLQATTFITSPQVGQMVYPTLNDSTATTDTTLQDAFRHDKFSFYTSAGWKHHTPQETEYTSGNSTSTEISTDRQTSAHFMPFTMPSTDKWYKVSAVEFGHDTVSAVVNCYFILTNSLTPNTSKLYPVIGTMQSTSMGGAFGTSTKVTKISCKPILPGSIIHLGVWATGSVTAGVAATGSATESFYQDFGGASTIASSISLNGTPAVTKPLAIKLYYIGYN